MTRLPDWEERLAAVLASSFARPFKYGEFDCCLFICDCVQAVIGVDWAADLRGTYSDKIGAALGMQRASGGGVETVAEDIAAFYRIVEIQPALAKRGDVVLADLAEGPTLGVCLGEHAAVAVADHQGLSLLGIEHCRRAWSI